jgi:histidine triad (HIT) family protein
MRGRGIDEWVREWRDDVAECLFCKIASKEIPAEILHESDSIVALWDINPTAPKHVLVIPKRHIDSARDLTAQDSDLLGEVFETIAQIAEREGLDAGYRIVTNVGRAGGQAIDHLHFHLIGGREMTWPPG